MLMSEALRIIIEGNKPAVDPKGYIVHFEAAENGMLYGGYFPQKYSGETLFETEELAWIVAKAFAEKTRGKYVNIYVVDSNFNPVPDYHDKKIENR